MDIEKITSALKFIYRDRQDKIAELEVLSFSKLEYCHKIESAMGARLRRNSIDIHTRIEVFSKYHNVLESLRKSLLKDFRSIMQDPLDYVIILPDYESFNVVNLEIQPIYTEWEEINQLQTRLINNLKTSFTSIDYQNIGNACRTTLQKLAISIFIKEKHTPKNIEIKLDKNSYKNQLQSYIQTELSGSQNQELRKFGEAAIECACRSVDLANTLTHKLEAERNIAELCVIGTISCISIIKMIYSK